jgi:competence protein ComEA
MDREAQMQRYVTFGAALLLAGAVVAALMLLVKPVRLRDELSGPAERERLARPDMRLDLNKATAEELTMLPGIGPAFAESIVRFRRERGRINSLEELMEISGIGPARLEAMAPHVVVDADDDS